MKSPAYIKLVQLERKFLNVTIFTDISPQTFTPFPEPLVLNVRELMFRNYHFLVKTT